MHTNHLKYPSSEKLKAGLRAEAKYLPKGLLQNEESQLKYGLLQATEPYYRNSCETQIFTERDILSMLSIKTEQTTSFINLSGDDMPASFQVLVRKLEIGNVKYSLESLNIENIATQTSEGADNRIFLMLDGSWANHNNEELPDKLELLHQNMKANDRFLVTVDQIKDPKTILAAYTSAAAEAYYKSIINSLNTAYEGNADEQKFEYHPSYNPETGLVSHFLISKAAQRVKLEKLNFTVNLARWETILIAQEQKYSHAMLNQVVVSAGFSILDYVADEKGYLAAYVIEKANW